MTMGTGAVAGPLARHHRSHLDTEDGRGLEVHHHGGLGTEGAQAGLPRDETVPDTFSRPKAFFWTPSAP